MRFTAVKVLRQLARRDLCGLERRCLSSSHASMLTFKRNDACLTRRNVGVRSSFDRPLHTTRVGFNKVVPFLLADIGEGIMEVTIKEWFVDVGDHVSQFDHICEVQSDKAAVTITSRYDGVVTKRHYGVDDVARVGHALVDIELDDGVAESVAEDQVDDVTGSDLTGQLESELPSQLDLTETRSHPTVLATPVVRRIAAENKINLADVIGTGKDGRVLKEDIHAFLSKRQSGRGEEPIIREPLSALRKPADLPPVKPTPASKSEPSVTGADTVVTLRGIRKAMAQSMSESLRIPHFGYCDEIDMSSLVALRKQLKGSQLLGNVPFSYMPVILKACSQALKQFPILNSSLLPSGDQIVLKAAHNIGFAMDGPDGLIVPNIKNVDQLSVLEIAAEMHRLISLGENGKLGLDDLSNGTFSISNIGSIGGTYAKPVIFPPQVAIGALGKIQVLPRFDSEGSVVPCHIMNVSWSADHRVIEGAQMARFSNLLKTYLENPASLLLNLK